MEKLKLRGILLTSALIFYTLVVCSQSNKSDSFIDMAYQSRYSILGKGEVAVVLTSGERICSSSVRFTQKVEQGNGMTNIYFTDSKKQLDFDLKVKYPDNKSARISLNLVNRSSSSQFIDRIESISGLINISQLPDTVQALITKTWNNKEGIIKPLVKEGDNIDSRYTIALDSPSFAGGFLTAKQHFNYITVTRENNRNVRVTAWGKADGAELKPGKSRQTDELFITVEANSLKQLERFADLAAKENNVKLWPENRVAWCTWYAGWMFDKIDIYKEGIRQGIEDNIPYIKKDFSSRGDITLRICDDRIAYGDWGDTTKAFPYGFSHSAKIISDAGLTPGVWYPVYWANAGHNIAKQHPEWMGMNNDGTLHKWYWTNPLIPILQPSSEFNVFDSSVPEVQDYFESTARKWAERGFKYVTNDYLAYSTYIHKYHNSEYSKAQVLRKGLEAVRRGLGDTIFYRNIIAADFGPCMGIANDVRISGDSHGYNPSAFRNTGAVWFYNHRVWLNDPSAIVFKRYGELNDMVWNKMWVSWIALAGTVMTFGEQMNELPLEAINIYKKVFPPLNRAGRPLDLWENQPYALWGIQPDEADGAYDLFGVFNLEAEQNKTVLLNLDEVSSRTRGWEEMNKVPGRYLLWDFWAEKLYKSEGHSLKTDMPSKTGRIFAMRADLGRPQFVGTNGHFSMGFKETKDIKWDRSSRTLSGMAKGNGGDPVTLFFHLPESYNLEYAMIGDQKHSPMIKEGVICLEVPASESMVSFKLVFKGKNANVPKDRDFVHGKAAQIAISGK